MTKGRVARTILRLAKKYDAEKIPEAVIKGDTWGLDALSPPE